MKTCSKCRRRKSLSKFYRNVSKPDGLYDYCKICWRDYLKNSATHLETKRRCAKRYYEKHSVEIRRRVHKYWEKAGREKNLKSYGLTSAKYDLLLQSQHGVCAICGEPPKNGRRLAVDHDHRMEVVRGLLCGRCNTGLGLFQDNPQFLSASLKYLTKA